MVHSVIFPLINIYADFSPASSQPRNDSFLESSKIYSFRLFLPPSKECNRGERQLDALGSLKNFKNLNHLHQPWKVLVDEERDKQEKI